ncbi:Mitochondrial ribonuclease P protein 1-like protein, partial [Stegodyphus mimosarum]
MNTVYKSITAVKVCYSYCTKLTYFSGSIRNKSNFNRLQWSFSSSNVRLLTNNSYLNSSKLNTGAKETSDLQQNDKEFAIAKYSELVTDLEKEKKILMLLMEHEVAKLEGKKVPSKISVMDMRELLSMYSYSSRLKYMGFLFEREQRKAADRRKKEIKQKDRQAWLIEKENIKPPEHIQYGIGHNTMIIRIRRKTVMRFYNQKLANAVLYGQKFIVDMDYDCFMRKQDCNNCGEQLLELYSVNRKNRNPYDLFFCNVDNQSQTMTSFRRYMPNLYAPENFITLTDLNYLDIFPKEKLVYITPFAKEPMKTYDHNAVYIVGGLVDKCIKEPVVLAKAKREGIRAVHLPFDEYLMWGRGNRSLPLNQILEILLEMKNTNDWHKAFRYVPQ